MGTSYMAATQSAAATLNPPHLAAMFITEGPSNYYHCSMRHNGALEQRFLIYAFHMAVTSPEARANPALCLALMEARTNLGQWLRRLPLKRGATPLRLLPSYEQWAIDLQTRAVYDEYWLQRGYAISEYYAEHADVPTVYFGSWYDSYARATTENFVALEHHFADVPFWDDFIDGVPKPIIQHGYIPVPEAPGLGFTVNEEAIKAHLIPDDPGYFEPTPEWDSQRSWDRLWS